MQGNIRVPKAGGFHMCSLAFVLFLDSIASVFRKRTIYDLLCLGHHHQFVLELVGSTRKGGADHGFW